MMEGQEIFCLKWCKKIKRRAQIEHNEYKNCIWQLQCNMINLKSYVANKEIYPPTNTN